MCSPIEAVMSRPTKCFSTLPQPQKLAHWGPKKEKNNPNIRSITKGRNEGITENKNSSAIQINPSKLDKFKSKIGTEYREVVYLYE